MRFEKYEKRNQDPRLAAAVTSPGLSSAIDHSLPIARRWIHGGRTLVLDALAALLLDAFL
jgi:hypothetical protein